MNQEIDVAQQYRATMDSVNLINTMLAKVSLTEQEQERMTANKSHIEIMLGKDFWTEDQDLEPFRAALLA